MSKTPFSLLERLGGNQGDREPTDWNRFVVLYTPLLRRWLQGQVPQEADVDDLVQDVLAVVVAKVPEFRHNGSNGAFRSWLRSILAYRLKNFWRQRLRVPIASGHGRFDQFLAGLEEPDSELAQRWDAEHDQFIATQLLEQIRPEFSDTTWRAFEGYVLAGRTPADVAAELAVSTNVVFISRSRVLRRLREEANGLIDPADALPTPPPGP